MNACRQVAPIRVLVVDDQKIYRDTAEFVLSMSEGFELVGMATSGEEALACVTDIKPDLVLMDINMEGIDGLETTRRLLDTDPGAAVIVFSTHSAADYAQLAADAGAIGFISKAELSPQSLSFAWLDRQGG